MQLRNGAGLVQVPELVGYLAELGVSHLYTSPYLPASEGSTRGYDIVDPTGVDHQLGGDETDTPAPAPAVRAP